MKKLSSIILAVLLAFIVFRIWYGPIFKPNMLPNRVFSTYEVPASIDRSPESQAKAANEFLSLLDPETKENTLFGLDSVERKKWMNDPPEKTERGARLGDLNEEQIQAAMRLLYSVLSEKGFYRAWSVPLADQQNVPPGKRYTGFGTEDYRLVIFGNPSPETPWALQFDGHHLAINISIHGSKMCLSPSLIGTEPHQFELGDRTVSPIKPFTEKAFHLIRSLTGDQRAKAIVSKERIDTALAKPEFDGEIPQPIGISGSELGEEERKLLLDLISEYVATLPDRVAEVRIQELENGLDETWFSWGGTTKDRSAVSYRIQGPTLIVEYACQVFNPDAPYDHIHTVYRDPTNEYGAKFMRAEAVDQ